MIWATRVSSRFSLMSAILPILRQTTTWRRTNGPCAKNGVNSEIYPSCTRSQIGADLLPNLGGEPFARNIDERGYEPAKTVPAHEYARSRPQRKMNDPFGDARKLFRFDLEQFVARKCFEDVEQGLAGMAGGIVSGPENYALHLVAQQRNMERREVIGRCREQTGHAQFARGLSVGRIQFYDDAVGVNAPMYIRAEAGLGDQQRRGAEKVALRVEREFGQIARTANRHAFRIAQQAEAGAGDRLAFVTFASLDECVFAHAQKSEVAVHEPLQESLGFPKIVAGRNRSASPWRR